MTPYEFDELYNNNKDIAEIDTTSHFKTITIPDVAEMSINTETNEKEITHTSNIDGFGETEVWEKYDENDTILMRSFSMAEEECDEIFENGEVSEFWGLNDDAHEELLNAYTSMSNDKDAIDSTETFDNPIMPEFEYNNISSDIVSDIYEDEKHIETFFTDEINTSYLLNFDNSDFAPFSFVSISNPDVFLAVDIKEVSNQEGAFKIFEVIGCTEDGSQTQLCGFDEKNAKIETANGNIGKILDFVQTNLGDGYYDQRENFQKLGEWDKYVDSAKEIQASLATHDVILSISDLAKKTVSDRATPEVQEAVTVFTEYMNIRNDEYDLADLKPQASSHEILAGFIPEIYRENASQSNVYTSVDNSKGYQLTDETINKLRTYNPEFGFFAGFDTTKIDSNTIKEITITEPSEIASFLNKYVDDDFDKNVSSISISVQSPNVANIDFLTTGNYGEEAGAFRAINEDGKTFNVNNLTHIVVESSDSVRPYETLFITRDDGKIIGDDTLSSVFGNYRLPVSLDDSNPFFNQLSEAINGDYEKAENKDIFMQSFDEDKIDSAVKTYIDCMRIRVDYETVDTASSIYNIEKEITAKSNLETKFELAREILGGEFSQKADIVTEKASLNGAVLNDIKELEETKRIPSEKFNEIQDKAIIEAGGNPQVFHDEFEKNKAEQKTNSKIQALENAGVDVEKFIKIHGDINKNENFNKDIKTCGGDSNLYHEKLEQLNKAIDYKKINLSSLEKSGADKSTYFKVFSEEKKMVTEKLIAEKQNEFVEGNGEVFREYLNYVKELHGGGIETLDISTLSSVCESLTNYVNDLKFMAEKGINSIDAHSLDTSVTDSFRALAFDEKSNPENTSDNVKAFLNHISLGYMKLPYIKDEVFSQTFSLENEGFKEISQAVDNVIIDFVDRHNNMIDNDESISEDEKVFFKLVISYEELDGVKSIKEVGNEIGQILAPKMISGSMLTSENRKDFSMEIQNKSLTDKTFGGEQYNPIYNATVMDETLTKQDENGMPIRIGSIMDRIYDGEILKGKNLSQIQNLLKCDGNISSDIAKKYYATNKEFQFMNTIHDKVEGIYSKDKQDSRIDNSTFSEIRNDFEKKFEEKEEKEALTIGEEKNIITNDDHSTNTNSNNVNIEKDEAEYMKAYSGTYVTVDMSKKDEISLAKWKDDDLKINAINASGTSTDKVEEYLGKKISNENNLDNIKRAIYETGGKVSEFDTVYNLEKNGLLERLNDTKDKIISYNSKLIAYEDIPVRYRMQHTGFQTTKFKHYQCVAQYQNLGGAVGKNQFVTEGVTSFKSFCCIMDLLKSNIFVTLEVHALRAIANAIDKTFHPERLSDGIVKEMQGSKLELNSSIFEKIEQKFTNMLKAILPFENRIVDSIGNDEKEKITSDNGDIKMLTTETEEKNDVIFNEQNNEILQDEKENNDIESSKDKYDTINSDLEQKELNKSEEQETDNENEKMEEKQEDLEKQKDNNESLKENTLESNEYEERADVSKIENINVDTNDNNEQIEINEYVKKDAEPTQDTIIIKDNIDELNTEKSIENDKKDNEDELDTEGKSDKSDVAAMLGEEDVENDEEHNVEEENNSREDEIETEEGNNKSDVEAMLGEEDVDDDTESRENKISNEEESKDFSGSKNDTLKENLENDPENEILTSEILSEEHIIGNEKDFSDDEDNSYSETIVDNNVTIEETQVSDEESVFSYIKHSIDNYISDTISSIDEKLSSENSLDQVIDLVSDVLSFNSGLENTVLQVMTDIVSDAIKSSPDNFTDNEFEKIGNMFSEMIHTINDGFSNVLNSLEENLSQNNIDDNTVNNITDAIVNSEDPNIFTEEQNIMGIDVETGQLSMSNDNMEYPQEMTFSDVENISSEMNTSMDNYFNDLEYLENSNNIPEIENMNIENSVEDLSVDNTQDLFSAEENTSAVEVITEIL